MSGWVIVLICIVCFPLVLEAVLLAVAICVGAVLGLGAAVVVLVNLIRHKLKETCS